MTGFADLLAERTHSRVPLPTHPGFGGTPKDPGPATADPALAGRLGDLDIPVHVRRGESDRVVDPDYGRACAAAIPISTFTLLPRTGHLPRAETPEEQLGALLDLGNRPRGTPP